MDGWIDGCIYRGLDSSKKTAQDVLLVNSLATTHHLAIDSFPIRVCAKCFFPTIYNITN